MVIVRGLGVPGSNDYYTTRLIDLAAKVSNDSPMNRAWHRTLRFALLLVAIGILLPSRERFVRDVLIDARPATVFTLVNDFRQIDEWAPFTADDPNARLDISGPATGVGASIGWKGRIIGQGRQTIVESVPFERIVIEAVAGNGRPTRNIIQFAAAGGGTRITWARERHYGFNLAGRYFGLLLDYVEGPRLEEHLLQLDDMAESLPRADFSDLQVEKIYVQAQDIAYLTTTSRPQAAALSAAMSDSFFDILGFIDAHGLTEAGAPISITRRFSGSELTFDAAIPVRGITQDTPRAGTRVRIGKTYEGPVIRAIHRGSYARLGDTHEKIAAYLAASGIKRNGNTWESYVSEPGRTDASGLITYIYYPIRN